MAEIEKVLLSEQLEWYRLQRHDILNHWQVVMGYLQLNQNEKALRYMREGLKGLEIEQKISQIPQPIVSASLLGLVVKLRKESISVNLSYSEILKQPFFWQEYWREEYARPLYGYTIECLENSIVHKDNDGSLKADMSAAFETDKIIVSYSLLANDDLVFKHKLNLTVY